MPDEKRYGLLRSNKCDPKEGNKCVNDISEFGSVNPDCKFNINKYIAEKTLMTNMPKEINNCIKYLNKEILGTDERL